jgi:hypothetical protein
MNVSEEAVQGAGSIISGDDGTEGSVKIVEGTFGDRRDFNIEQELPEDA